ncbi:YkgJ family cysteine cluster protein [Ahniella affigens]|uniref:YkgJ family cysteine cluster protein n=1 Tax=Ahniella affigens TaxID=2021234 RepID=UPI003CCE1A30
MALQLVDAGNADQPIAFACRTGCAACCIAPSISSPIPGMPNGKPAGVPCVQLDADLRCRIFGQPERPNVCSSLRPDPAMCGDSREQALAYLTDLEQVTASGQIM